MLLWCNKYIIFFPNTLFILQVPHDEDDAAMDELLTLAHEFLQHFCLGNQQNQAILHKHLDLFLNAGVSKITERIIFVVNLLLSTLPLLRIVIQ